MTDIERVETNCPKCLGIGTVGDYQGKGVWKVIPCPTCKGKKGPLKPLERENK